MAQWDEDVFMSEWDRKYVSTNIKKDARPYDSDLFLALSESLKSKNSLENISPAIIVASCCAVGRADAVGRFFDDLTAKMSASESQTLFIRLREAITIIFPYLGMPTCVPACYGMIGVIQRKGDAFGSTSVLRRPVITEEDAAKGHELRSRIYSGVGNSEIFGLMDKYFHDLYTCSTIVAWGYLIAKANEEVFHDRESHLIVATAIMALGATRQTRSHIKATLGIGNTIQSINAVKDVVSRIMEWADRPSLGPLNVEQLAADVQSTLGSQLSRSE